MNKQVRRCDYPGCSTFTMRDLCGAHQHLAGCFPPGGMGRPVPSGEWREAQRVFEELRRNGGDGVLIFSPDERNHDD